MQTRRSFLGALGCVPVSALLPPVVSPKTTNIYGWKTTAADQIQRQQPRHLPVGCDLSYNAIQWAMNIGKEYELGKPKFLYIGPENKWVARELLGVPHKPYTADSEINCLWDDLFIYEVIH